jgi:2-dehydro-3-deoxygluconokinase
MSEPGFRVSTMGEALLRLSVNGGDRLEDAPAFEVHVAGSESNVAYALARVGVPVRWTSVLPRNALGNRIASTLSAGGVDLSAVRWVDDARVGTYYVEFSPSPRPTQVLYDRRSSAAALATVDDFDWDQVLDATAFHISGITFALSQSSRTVARHALMEAQRRNLFISLDVNYRRLLWGPDEAAATLREIAPMLDLLICPAADAARLFGVEGDWHEVASTLRTRLGVENVVVTNGATGAVGAIEGETFDQAAYEVEVVDRIGAGDALAAGVLWGLLEDGSLRTGLERGAAMAALIMTLRGDLYRLGAAEVEALHAGQTFEIER